jgi:hypothetical protein
MVRDIDRAFDTAERIATLEVTTAAHEEDIKSHAEHLKSLDKAVVTLIVEVRGIRKAIYIMAASVAAQIPALRDMLGWIKHLL